MTSQTKPSSTKDEDKTTTLIQGTGSNYKSKALSDHVDDEDKLNNETLSSLGQRGGWVINESGLYSLILSSKLPSIRKHGAYMTDDVLHCV